MTHKLHAQSDNYNFYVNAMIILHNIRMVLIKSTEREVKLIL